MGSGLGDTGDRRLSETKGSQSSRACCALDISEEGILGEEEAASVVETTGARSLGPSPELPREGSVTLGLITVN